MDQDLEQRLARIEQKVNDTHAMMRKLWRANVWIFWITVALIVLPLIGLAFAIPSYLKSIDINSLLQ